ncbi:MAG: hypothetical protein WBE37_02100 [Bryobacteraceae bacterium]
MDIRTMAEPISAAVGVVMAAVTMADAATAEATVADSTVAADSMVQREGVADSTGAVDMAAATAADIANE